MGSRQEYSWTLTQEKGRAQGLEQGHLDSDPSLVTVCGLGRGFAMSSGLSVKWCSCYLPSLLPGSPKEPKEIVRGLCVETSTGRLTVRRFEAMGRPVDERIEGEGELLLFLEHLLCPTP